MKDSKFIRHLDRDIRQPCEESGDDRVVLLTGRERGGKSTLGHIACNLLDKDWNVEDQVHWSSGPYMATAPKVSARGRKEGHVKAMRHDEFGKDGASYNFMKRNATDFADWVMVCGQYNMAHIITMPARAWVSPIIRQHRAYYEWRVMRKYREHAVASVYQLRNDSKVFDTPRHLFSFSFPKLKSKTWLRECQRKDEYATAISEGDADQSGQFSLLVDRIERRLGGLLVDGQLQ